MFITYAAALVIGAILLVADIFIGAALLTSVSTAIWLAVRGTETMGRVARVEARRPSGATTVGVAYDTPNGGFETESTSQRPRVGAQVPVRYHPDRPSFATTLVRPWKRAVIGFPVVLWVAALGAGMVTGSVWYFTGTHTQLQLPVTGGSFFLVLALSMGYYAVGRYTVMLQWRRMARVDGRIQRYKDPAPGLGGAGIQIAFESGDGAEKFWVRAGSVPGSVGDTVTVHYDPDKPATSATVQGSGDARAAAIASTVAALALAGIGVAAIITLLKATGAG